MANTKEYKIVINGIQESIDAVKALNTQLDSLESRIKSLEGKAVGIKASGGGSNGSTSALSEEAAIQKEINKLKSEGAALDAKIAAAQDEVYKRVDATKQLYKETIADQKALAAQERLTADAYNINTMQGMKSKLADLKAVINTTDLGDSNKIKDMVQAANDLNNKLKDIEQSYGQFGRNVGNYANGVAEGLQKIGIEVGGTVREFDNAKQALKELKKERDSLAVKNDMGLLSEEEVERFKELIPIVSQLQSSIQDAGKPMDALMDTMQSFVALTQAGKGLAAFFGFDDDEIDKSIQKLVGLQNAMQGLQTIQKQLQSNEGIASWLTKGNDAIDKLVNSIFGVEKASKAATVASKALGTALKAIGIGALVAGITALITLLETWTDKQNKAAEAAEEAAEKVRKSIEQQRQTFINASAQYENTASRLSHLRSEYLTTNDALKKTSILKEATKEFKNLGMSVNSVTDAQNILVKQGDKVIEMIRLQGDAAALAALRVEAFKKSFNMLLENGYEVRSASILAGNSGVVTELDKQLDKVNEKINKFQKELGINVEQSSTKLEKTVKDIEADIAKARIDAMKQGLTKALAQLELERNKRIAEAKKTGKLVDEQIEQINKTFQQKIFDARVEYHSNLLNEERKYIEKIENLNEEMYQKEVEISRKRNELNLEGKINKLTEFDEKSSERDYTNNLKTITYDYNFDLPPKVLSEYKELEDELKRIDIVMDNLDTSTDEGSKAWAEYAEKSDKLTLKLKELTEKYPLIIFEAEKVIGSNLNDAIENRTNAVEEYYQKVLGYAKEYADEDVRIEKDRLKKELQIEQDAEKERHKIAVSSIYDKETDKSNIGGRPRYLLEGYKTVKNNGMLDNMSEQEAAKYFESSRKAMDEWLNSLDEKVEKGKISWEEYIQITGATALKGYQEAKTDYEEFLDMYNSLSDEEKAVNEERLQKLVTNLNEKYVKYLEKVRTEQEAHDKQMKLFKEKYDADVEQADRDHQEKLRQATVDYHSQMISEYERAMSAISNKLDKAEKKTPLGFINYGATKKALKDLEASIDTTLHEIEVDKMNLFSELQEGKISFGDFSALMDQLNTLQVQAQETSQNVSNSLKNLFTDWMDSINQIAGQLGSALSSLVGALGDYTDTMYENRIKDLDKYIEEYEKKLDEQKEITQKYADDVNSIEEELSSSRGDRRQQLIDQLNAQLAAQRGSLAQEKRMEKEKQRMEQEKEELEKEKFEQQKKVQRAQAMMSGALAVTNALAVQPIWVGIATAAMVAAMTAVQIATINAQKYANGGVIQGKSHSQGGVKVLGGQAEVEGGEFITNKVTTSKNVDLLEYINTKRRKVNLEDLIDFYGSPVRRNVQAVRTKFADGGIIPTLRTDFDMNDRLLTAFEDYSNRQVVVSVVDINDRQAAVDNVKVLAGLTD